MTKVLTMRNTTMITIQIFGSLFLIALMIKLIQVGVTQ